MAVAVKSYTSFSYTKQAILPFIIIITHLYVHIVPSNIFI